MRNIPDEKSITSSSHGSMSSLQKIDKTDRCRPLLTEVLPHETPLWFSNSMLHSRLKAHNSPLRSILRNIKAPLKPLDYRIRKTTKGARRLSLIHPRAQLQICDFYEKYADAILYYCNRSPCSLRYPARIASAFREKNSVSRQTQTEGVDEFGSDSIYASSYFSYKRHAFLYKFFDSYDFQNLEKSYNRMSQVDIESCFHGIYTHSISWAVKNRRIAKQDKHCNGGFDRSFDDIMQSANYRETNGIPIGPEIARIFAEVILQEIDVRVIRRLEKKGYRHRHHYDFRRYVDDFFIFTKSDEAYDEFIEALEDELRFFKLSLNNAKTLQIKRPFITDLTIFKMEISPILEEIFSNRFTDENQPRILSLPSSRANRNIGKIKATVKSNNVTYQSVSNYLLSTICKKIEIYVRRLLRNSANGHPTIGSYKWILADLDLIFFLHAMDPRVVSTDKVAKTVRLILLGSGDTFSDGMEAIHKKCFDVTRKAIEIYDDGNDVLFSVEILNLFLVMDLLKSYRHLSPDFIEIHFLDRLESLDSEDLETYEDKGGYYFLWGTLMLYTRGVSDYAPIHKKLMDIGKNLIVNCPLGLPNTETFLLFFDYISCPSISALRRARLVQEFERRHSLNLGWRTLLNQFNGRGTVIDWNDSRWLERNLLKREYRFAYE